MTADLDFGTVKRLDAATGRPYVEVRQRAGVHTYGPCPIVEGPWTAGLLVSSPDPDVSGSGGDPAHTHTIGHDHGAGVDLAVGDRVLVGYVGPARDAVVLGRLR